jgi:multicomponent Na+:H+ antiporter subunit D
VIFYLQLLLFSGLAFFLLLPLMRRTETLSLDTDWLWRVALSRVALVVGSVLNRAGKLLSDAVTAVLNRLGPTARKLLGGAPDDSNQPRGVFARAWPIGTTALWIAVLLTAYVFFYYLA